MPTIKQVPGRRTPGYYQINLNQHDSPFGGDELIKEADAFDRPDSRGESSWIASWDPFPVPIVSESKIDWIVDQHPWMNFHSRNLFAIELPCRRELISCRVSLPAIDGCFGEAEESSAAWWFTTGSLLVCFCFCFVEETV